MDNLRISIISWGHPGYDYRNELLGRRMGALIHYIYYGQQGKLYQAPLRFIIEGIRSWNILRSDRPDLVIVQNPPIFSVIVVYLFASVHGIRFIIDSHSGAFISPKWRWSLGIHRFLSRHALATLVHNHRQGDIVQSWNCQYFILGAYGSKYPEGTRFSFGGKFNIAVIGSIIKQESLDTIFSAAERMHKVTFYVTGHVSRISAELLAKKPDNCVLTDYLPEDQYIGLLRGADAVLVQTVRENTLCMGGFEAVGLGKPLIISDLALLREYFSKGTVYIPNSAEGVIEGVMCVQQTKSKLQADMQELRKELIGDWEQEYKRLIELIDDIFKDKIFLNRVVETQADW